MATRITQFLVVQVAIQHDKYSSPQDGEKRGVVRGFGKWQLSLGGLGE